MWMVKSLAAAAFLSLILGMVVLPQERVLIPTKPKNAGALFQIHYRNKWGFIDRLGRIIVPPQFDGANNFFDGVAAVRNHGRWGYITETGTVAIAFAFDAAGDFSDGLAPVSSRASGAL